MVQWWKRSHCHLETWVRFLPRFGSKAKFGCSPVAIALALALEVGGSIPRRPVLKLFVISNYRKLISCVRWQWEKETRRMRCFDGSEQQHHHRWPCGRALQRGRWHLPWVCLDEVWKLCVSCVIFVTSSMSSLFAKLIWCTRGWPFSVAMRPLAGPAGASTFLI